MGGDQQTGKTAAEQAKQEKADRLAKALRDNLHRRKAQARARRQTAGRAGSDGLADPNGCDASKAGPS